MKKTIRFDSIFSRIVFTLVISIFLTQISSNLIWSQYYESRRSVQAKELAIELANSVASTVNFFGALPREYRHIILQQLRNMGGARFFVSVNDEKISINSIKPTNLSEKIKTEYSDNLTLLLGQQLYGLDVQFAEPQNLKVFKNDVSFIELPDRWAQNSLVLEGNPPLLVAQVKLQSGEWLYLAALLPDPYFLSRKDQLSNKQWLFALAFGVVLSFIFWWLARWLTRPLLNLSKAAYRLGKDPLHPVKLEFSGTREIQQLSHAFDNMQRRLHRYIDDRDHLFSAISHDLKTPITRLRLRSEMLEDEVAKGKINQDLLELEELVKGALLYSKGINSTENHMPIDIKALLNDINNDLLLRGVQFQIEGDIDTYFEGRPLELKRCFSNVIENALNYGLTASVTLAESDSYITISVKDNGPGIPESQFEEVFKPFTRLESSRNRNTGGSGLGLSIARNLIHGHGGTLSLSNHANGGLLVTMSLPIS